jgi:hypothetical protein
LKKLFYILLIVSLCLFGFIACEGDSSNASLSSNELQDPYEAYKLVREKSYNEGNTLQSAMMAKPPSVITLEPVFYYRMHYTPIQQSGKFTLNKGGEVVVDLDLELVHESGTTVPLKSTITLKFDGSKHEDLFHADTSTYGNPTLYIDGAYVSELGQHNISNKDVNFELITSDNGYGYNLTGPAEEFLYVALGVDKGKATQADGNIGFLYFRITGVKK